MIINTASKKSRCCIFKNTNNCFLVYSKKKKNQNARRQFNRKAFCHPVRNIMVHHLTSYMIIKRQRCRILFSTTSSAFQSSAWTDKVLIRRDPCTTLNVGPLVASGAKQGNKGETGLLLASLLVFSLNKLQSSKSKRLRLSDQSARQ